MSVAVKSNPALWSRIVTSVKKSNVGGLANTWNARKAQLAVLKYKSLGGKYIGRKSKRNSLSKWTREDWGYINEKKGNRYLPKRVRSKLTSSEKRTENRRKRSASRKNLKRASYSASVLKKFNKYRY